MILTEYLLKPTPGLGVDTRTCSYCGAEAYPRTNLGRPVALNCDATRVVDLRACIVCIVNWYLLRRPIGRIMDCLHLEA
jgi:hypothetical protein